MIILDAHNSTKDCVWKIKLSKEEYSGHLNYEIYYEKHNIIMINYNDISQEKSSIQVMLKHWLAGTPVDAPLNIQFRPTGISNRHFEQK